MIGATATETGKWWPSCGNCDCPTGECDRDARWKRLAESGVRVIINISPRHGRTATAKVVVEMQEVEERAWWKRRKRREQTRAGWTWPVERAPRRRPVAPLRLFERRPGRPNRHHGRGGPRPLRGIDTRMLVS